MLPVEKNRCLEVLVDIGTERKLGECELRSISLFTITFQRPIKLLAILVVVDSGGSLRVS